MTPTQLSQMTLRHHIGSTWVDGQCSAASTNPAFPHQVVAEYPVGGAREVDDAVRAARAVGQSWGAASPLARGRVLRVAAEMVRRNTHRLAVLMTSEQGKPIGEARAEVERTASILDYHAGQVEQPHGEIYAGATANEEIHTVRTPVGVVAVITPWNFPLAIPAWKLAPALAHGNTVVWKPSSRTPAMAYELARMLSEAGLPDGVLNVVFGPGRLGDELTRHPDIDAITFTGSEDVGRAIWSLGTATRPRIQLELGGNSPALVFADADLQRAVEAVAYGVIGSSGQKCTATRRVLVQQSILGPFQEALLARLGQAQVGDGREPATEVGPLISAEARAGVLSAIDDAVRQGAALPLGDPASPLPGTERGHFVRPTVLADLPNDAPILQTEIFGPVTSVHSFVDEDDAITLANASRHGLSAAVFTQDPALARRCVHAVAAGMIHVNNPTTGAQAHVPFGGMKSSSNPGPKEQGGTARDFFTELKTAYIQW
jgi:acyl-CoA reductase-like NAD-dependent aldehyde dehydrogenase